MKNSKEFNNVLDECLERLLIKGETIDQCLHSFPAHADELKPLLETVLATRQASSIQPRAEFRDRARNQLYSAFEEMEHKRSRALFGWGWQPRWATVVAIVLALFLAGGGGTVAAAKGSMPDNLLYPVKLATEKVQLAFTFSTLGKAELYARLADKRVNEIVYLAEKSEPEKIEMVATSLNNDLVEIAVLSSGQEPARGAISSEINYALEAEEGDVGEETGATEQAQVTEEAEAEEVEEAQALEAPAAEEVPVPEVAPETEKAQVEEAPLLAKPAGKGEEEGTEDKRRSELRETVIVQANNNIARLRALLETAPESIRPVLERAIALLEAGYNQALEALE